MKTYRGIVRVRPNEVILETGGIEVRLQGPRELFVPRDGLVTAVSGQQQGDTIQEAALASEAETAEAESTASFGPVIETIRRHQAEITSRAGVVAIRPGFRIAQNEGGETPAIVILTKPGAEIPALPKFLDSVPVEVRTATPQEIMEGVVPLEAWEGVIAEAAPNIGYTPPDPSIVTLKETNVHNIMCHVGPDSGWPSLKPFLEGTESHLTVAMYEFYADHIVDAVRELGEDTDLKLNIILQTGPKENDKDAERLLRETWGDRLSFTPASVSGPHRVFNNSYHTKVAVRDSKAFWLSSGNWSPNSQPVVEASSGPNFYRLGNREWHVIIENEELAQIYEKFIQHDIKQARDAGVPEAAPILPDLLVPESAFAAEAAAQQDHPFEPKTFAISGQAVKVRPLMSPDNYAKSVLDLVRSAKKSLYLQFSYIRQPSAEIFNDIISAIAEKMADPEVEVRVLVSRNQKQEHSDLLVGKRNWKRNMFRRQSSKMHNKGILVDGKIAVVGSNNWSSDGTQYNRDTSLVFHSRAIAKYYTEVFLFDWDNLSKPATGSPEIVPELAPDAGPTPLGKVRIPWQAWYDE
jgi:phosphatidylserine/phosphatidylglycerophosphate/cardiolipin synthase-like enzyme